MRNSPIAHNLRQPWVLLAAVSVLLLVLAPQPNDAAVDDALTRARLNARHGNADAAYLALEEAMSLDPALETLDTTAGRLALHAARLTEAEQHLTSALARNAQNNEATCLLGWVRLQQGDLNEAERFQTAECDQHGSFLLALSDAYLASGEISQAISIAETAFEFTPGSSDALETLAMLKATAAPEDALPLLRATLENQDQPGGVILDLIRVIEDASTESSIAFSLAAAGQVFVRHGHWQLAISALDAALQHEPDYPEALSYLGFAMDQLGQDGLPSLETAWNLAPGSTLTAMFLADHWIRAGSPDQAVTILEDALQRSPQDPALHAGLGDAHTASGDVAAAREAYIQAVELAPDQAIYWRALAAFSIQTEVEVEALGLPAARNAVFLSQGASQDVELLGYAHLLVGNLSLAQELLADAILQDPTRASSWLHWGLLQHIQGHLDEAARAFEQAAALNPDGAVGLRALRLLENLNR